MLISTVSKYWVKYSSSCEPDHDEVGYTTPFQSGYDQPAGPTHTASAEAATFPFAFHSPTINARRAAEVCQAEKESILRVVTLREWKPGVDDSGRNRETGYAEASGNSSRRIPGKGRLLESACAAVFFISPRRMRWEIAM